MGHAGAIVKALIRVQQETWMDLLHKKDDDSEDLCSFILISVICIMFILMYYLLFGISSLLFIIYDILLFVFVI